MRRHFSDGFCLPKPRRGRITLEMKSVCLLAGIAAFSSWPTSAKDGHANPVNSTITVPAHPQGSRTFYSYSYKPPGAASKSAAVSASDYAHKGATLVDSYGAAKKSKNWSATSSLNSAQSKLSAKTSQLKK
jgi:hypothetical protein